MNIDMRTLYLGLDLAHPIVASASPLTGQLDTLIELEAAGAAAVVLPSLFEEDAERATTLAFAVSGMADLAHAESGGHRLKPVTTLDVVEQQVRLVIDAKSSLRIPVIASVNGVTASGWTRYASRLAEAGADALELNVYRVIADTDESSSSVENDILSLITTVRTHVAVPLAVKIGPFFSALPAFIQRIVDVGADGVVLFNRFYQPDIDLDELIISPTLDLSTSADLRLPLRWTALLSARIHTDFALSGGVHSSDDAVKAVLAGASAVMTTSALLRNGPGLLTQLRDGLATWLTRHDYDSVAQACGSMSAGNVPSPDDYERANYHHVIQEASRRYRTFPSMS
jgi:dihydroorotate dehydrogenase (fumarate)